MTVNVVSIAIDKVQVFLYYAIHAQEQELQSNNNTLKSIISSSRMISDNFYQKVGLEGKKGVFSGFINEILLQCSGSCVFTTTLREEKIREKLGELFQWYYVNFGGKLLMKYECFQKDITSENDRLEAIKESKSRIRQKECMNKIIEGHKELLFQFRKTEKSLYFYDNSEYHAFVKNINKLCPDIDDINANHFRIAVIKADLDGMGNIFKNISDYRIYDSVSKILSETINLDALEKEAEKLQEKNPDFKIYPLYLAGDDIMFAVPVSQLQNGVDLCKTLLNNINDKLEKLEWADKLSISLGIDISFNREPIRYYFERVQNELDMAKKMKLTFESEVNESVAKLCLSGYTFYDSACKIADGDDAGYLSWPKFLETVQTLNLLIVKKFPAHYFLYGLLNKITDPSICSTSVKYSNAVLYHMIPQYLGSADKQLREGELLLLEALLRQVTVITKDASDKAVYSFHFDKKHRRKLEAYVRLLLLFCDERFKLTDEQQLSCREYDGWVSKRIRKAVFDRALQYLYEQNLDKELKWRKEPFSAAKKIRSSFICYESYMTSDNKRIPVFLKRKITLSMFFRMKKTGPDVEICASMIEASENRSQEEYEELRKKKQNEHKAPPMEPFDRNTFCKLASTTRLWTDDYVDSLMLFYKYHDMLLTYKKIYPTNISKERKANGKNKSRNYHRG